MTFWGRKAGSIALVLDKDAVSMLYCEARKVLAGCVAQPMVRPAVAWDKIGALVGAERFPRAVQLGEEVARCGGKSRRETMGEAGLRAQGARRRRGSGRRSPREEQEAAGWRRQGESEAAMSCGRRQLRGAESARKEQRTRWQKDSCSGRRRKQEVRLERVEVGNEVVWRMLQKKGEKAVGQVEQGKVRRR